MPKRKLTLRTITSNILMVTGAVSAVTGCVKQIMDVAGCVPTKKMIAYNIGGPHPPFPPPPPPPSFYDTLQSNAYIGIILVCIGLALVIVSRKLRTNDARP